MFTHHYIYRTDNELKYTVKHNSLNKRAKRYTYNAFMKYRISNERALLKKGLCIFGNTAEKSVYGSLGRSIKVQRQILRIFCCLG